MEAPMKNPVYTARARVTGGRGNGRGRTPGGELDVQLRLPPELGGDGDGANPEQLFAAGWAACFTSAMQFVAGKKKIDVSGASVTAEIGLGPNGSGGFKLDATLRVNLPDHLSPEARRELVEATHQVCPYSNATRGNIPVNLIVE
jgi:lipoyl-dependent peroxiredoxin